MVFVNEKKFACESCIKGHRSSACSHTSRPLFEIKKKGRPVSQCERCRALRVSRRVHGKCCCSQAEKDSFALASAASGSTVDSQASGQAAGGRQLLSIGSKSKRYIPIIPALPNGLRDALPLPSSFDPGNVRQPVNALLNPCSCKSIWKCKCRTASTSSSHNTETVSSNLNLATLAKAAELLLSTSPLSSFSISPSPSPSIAAPKSAKTSKKNPRSRSTTPPPPKPVKRPYISSSHSPSASIQRYKLIHLPSLDLETGVTVPTFPTMPPISTLTSLAGSGCTCGVECMCPGCMEHNKPTQSPASDLFASAVPTSSHDVHQCTDECTTCVDNTRGIALPGYGPEGAAKNMIDRFFERAAALPLPPLPSQNQRERVELPKLECCGGRCRCPEGNCSCGNGCDGSCARHGHGQGRDMLPEPAALAVRSCCAGKRV